MATTYTVGLTGSGATYICDGTGDQTQINQALAAANGNPGSTVRLSDGTYNISAQILMGSSTTLTGNTADPTAVKLRVPNSGAGAFPDGTAIIERLGSGVATGVEISYMEIDGNCVPQSTTLGLAHGKPSSSGSGVERCIQFAGGSGSYPKAKDINIHHMYFHDAFGEAIHIYYAQNVRFHHNSCYNMQHDAIFLIECAGSGNEINNNIIEGITDGCIRLDNCTDFKIHDNTLRPYHGPNNNGAYEYGANGMQIANESNKTTKTNNLEIYNNTFTDIDLTGIWFNDVLGTAGTTSQIVHLYNNTFTNCGYTSGSSVNYGSGITVNGWGNGLTVEYNTFNGCYQNAIQILKAIGTANYTVLIKNNNIINTRGAGHSTSTLSASYKGYGILNLIPTRITATMMGNYFSGNLKGKYYPTNMSSTVEASTSNGLRPGSETTGGAGGAGGSAGIDITVGQDAAKASATYFYCNPDTRNAGTQLNSAITAAARSATATNPVYVFIKAAAAPYWINTQVLGKSNVNIVGDGISTVTLKLISGLSGGSTYPPGWGNDSGVSSSGAMLMLLSISNVRLSGFTLDGSWDDLYASTYPNRGLGYFNEITVAGSSNIFIDTIKFIRGANDGVMAGSTSNIVVANCEFNMIGHDGAAYISCTNSAVHHNKFAIRTNSAIRFDNTTGSLVFCNEVWTGTGGGAGIELQHDVNGSLLYNNHFHNITGASPGYGAIGYIGQTVSGSGVQVHNNIMDSCTYSTNDMPAGYTLTNNLILSAPILATNYGTNTGNLTSTTGLTKSGSNYARNTYYSGSGVTYGIDPTILLDLPPILSRPGGGIGGGTGGIVTPPTSTIPVRYIPGVRTIQPDWVFSDYYILNQDGSTHTSYVNGWPLNIISYTADTQKVLATNKSPSIDGWNIGDFGFEGSTATIVCGENSLESAWASISAWYSRAPAILELGDVYSEYFLECVPGKHSAVVRKDQGDIPAEYYEYSISVKTTIPYFQSIMKRIRSRLVYNSMQWSSDDSQPGNKLKNGSFDEWAPNANMTWTSQTSAADNNWRSVCYADTLGLFVAVAETGTDNRIAVSDGFGDWSIPSGLSSAANRDNNWRCGIWVPPSTNLSTGRFIGFSITGTGNRVITSDDLVTFTAQTSAADNSWGSACYISPNETLDNGRVVAVGYSGTNRVMYSDDFGVTWTAVVSSGEGCNWLSVAYSEYYKRLAAVAYTGTAGAQVMTSDDFGATWTNRASPTPVQKWTSVIRVNVLGWFVACSEDGTQQIMTSPDGITWTLRDTPYGSSTQTGGGTAITTTPYTTAVGSWYSSKSTAYYENSTSKEFEVVLPALTGGSVYRIDQVSCQLKTGLAGTTASLKVTIQAASLYSGAETTLVEWTNTTTTYIQKTFALAVNSATGETVTLRYYLKTSNASYRAYTTVIGYIFSVAATGGSSVTYARNQWRSLVVSPTTDLIVAVAQTGTGNRVMLSTNAVDWINGVSAADNNWTSIACSDYTFIAVGVSGTGNRAMVSSDNGTIENIPPAAWTLQNTGLKRGLDYMGDGSTGVLITGDGVTADIGGIYQSVNCDAGVIYVLSAVAKTIGLTQGSLVVEIFSGGSSIRQLVWNTATDPEEQQMTVKYDVSPLDSVIKVHGVGTPNDGALLFCDSVSFEKLSDFELSAVGNDIITYGHENTIPDIEVHSAVPQTDSSGVITGTQLIYDSGVTSYTSAATFYSQASTSMEFTVTIPAPTNGARNRLDEVSGMLSNVHAGTVSYMAVNMQAASLFGGAETPIANWTNSTTTATKQIKALSSSAGVNESIILKYFLKTSNASYRAVASHFGYKVTPLLAYSSSSDTNSLSIYNSVDPSTVIDICNLLPYGCTISINADYTGSFEYSTNFEDDSVLSTIESRMGEIVYSPANRTLTIGVGAAVVFTFDTKFAVTGMPFIQTMVISGIPQFLISVYRGTGYMIDGNTATDLINTMIYRELDSGANVSIIGNTVFGIQIQPKTGESVVLGSIFVHADLVTIDAPRPKIFATGEPNVFTSILSGNPVVCILKTRDRNMVI